MRQFHVMRSSQQASGEPACESGPRVREDARGRRLIQLGGKRILIYQVCYDAPSARRIAPFYTPYHNTALSPFFESSVIAELLAEHAHRAADYFGVFSWRFAAKIPLDARTLLGRIARDRFAADVYSFFGRIAERRLWTAAEHKHPGILRAATLLLRRLGLRTDLAELDAPIIYQNHFLCRSTLYERYGNELLRPALAAMADRTDQELQAALRQDSGYRDPRLPPARLMVLFGRPYCCLQPFLCERLFSTWLAFNPDVRVRHIWRGRFVETSNIVHEPEMATALSR
jgi:hypothetical protein